VTVALPPGAVSDVLWLISFALAPIAAGLHAAGLPLIWAVVIAVTALFVLVVAAGKR